jgi:hypothetical protein
MSKRKLMQGTKFRWDRNWTFYRAGAVLDESLSTEAWPEIDTSTKKEHDADQRSNWTGHIITLTSPILSRNDVTTVIATNKFRIYPPFWINKKASITSSFDEVTVPSGDQAINRIPIPSYAVKGVMTEYKPNSDSAPLYGLRIDCTNDVEIDELLSFFLMLARQYTKQWWVSSPRNPFDAGLRMAFQLRKNFQPRELLEARGAGKISAPWYGGAATQTLVGLEEPLNDESWNNVAQCIKRGAGIEPALQFFLDAIDEYMGYQDRRCILNLALLFEVCENKCLLMDGRNAKTKNKNILRDPILVSGKLKDTFRKVITDRDNIAHGRAPYHHGADFAVIVEYLEAGAELINLYLDKCRIFGWDKSLKLSI